MFVGHWMDDKNLLSRASPCFSRHVKPLVRAEFVVISTNPHWARVVGYGPFSLCVIHKEYLCLSSGDISRLLMMMCMGGLCMDLTVELILEYKRPTKSQI
jgi:hypothetical protein